MARCGLPRIDELWEGKGRAIEPGDPDSPSVAAVQELLRGHGLVCGKRGEFGAQTRRSVARFRTERGVGSGEAVDGELLHALVTTPACGPLATRPYVALALDLEWGGLTKIVALTAQLEGQGAFAAVNANTDRAGLSFGIIQWAQKPGRLRELLEAFRSAPGTEYEAIFGPCGEELIAHLRRPQGGVDTAGRTTDARFDLVREPWLSRFRAAGLNVPFQRVQIETALAAFRRSLERIRRYAAGLDSERACAFLLDLANQYGDSGARRICREAGERGGVRERLLAMTEVSVDRAPEQFRGAFRRRRLAFVESGELSDGALEL